MNSEKVDKPSRMVGVGDVLTFAQGKQIRVVRIIDPGKRRGPATEALTLYDDMSPPAPAKRIGPRPTKKERRVLEAKRHPPLE